MELLSSFRAEISGDEVKCQLFFQTKQLQKPDLILFRYFVELKDIYKFTA